MTSEPNIPLYYIANWTLSESQIAFVQRILSITPITCVLVTRAHDVELAREFSEEIIYIAQEDVVRFATKLAPVLVIGDAAVIDVVYDDGTKESLVPDAYTN